jgi:hypothetical protein
MDKVITDTWGFAHAIQRQFGCDREILEQLVGRFSENVVIACDRRAVADRIQAIAYDYLGVASADRDDFVDSILGDPDIDFDLIIDKYQSTDQEDVGYSYFTLRETILAVYSAEQCEEFLQRAM